MTNRYNMAFAVKCLDLATAAGAAGLKISFYHRSKTPWNIWKPNGPSVTLATIEEAAAYVQGVADGKKP